jgi:hypothetical protein
MRFHTINMARSKLRSSCMYHKRNDGQDDESALGPMLGTRRPKYEVLHDVLGPHIASQPGDTDLFFFINIGSVLRQLFSEYSVAKLTRGELNRHPRLLAAELINIAGHYRNYAFKHFGRRSTVVMYHSTERCADKLAVSPDFKANFYAKQLGGAAPEFDVVRAYTQFNLQVAARVTTFIPHIHIVDTKGVDPEAWPWAVAMEGRVTGSAILVSSWDSDLQYTLSPGSDPLSGHQWAVFRASGDHSRIVTGDTLFDELLRKSKTGGEIASQLASGHFPYVLALAGEDDVGIQGIPKYGMARAAKHVAKCATEGKLSADSPNLPALLESGNLSLEQAEIVSTAWSLLVHQDYAASISSSAMSAIDAQMINRSGLAELEKANTQYFNGRLNLELLFAGEGY